MSFTNFLVPFCTHILWIYLLQKKNISWVDFFHEIAKSNADIMITSSNIFHKIFTLFSKKSTKIESGKSFYLVQIT